VNSTATNNLAARPRGRRGGRRCGIGYFKLDSVKGALLCFAVCVCSACVHRGGGGGGVGPRTSQAPAFDVHVSYIGQSRIALGCLPRGGDSALFEMDVILDSLRSKDPATLSVIRRQRSAPRPGYVSQAVSVEVQRAGQTRLVGTQCWQDAGIVIRGSGTVLEDAKVYLDAPATILVRVFDAGRAVLVDGVSVNKLSDSTRIGRVRPPTRDD